MDLEDKTKQELVEKIFKDNQNYLRRIAFSITKDEEKVKDILQDVGVILCRHLDKYRGDNGATIKTWVGTITRNSAYNYLNKEKNGIRRRIIPETEGEFSLLNVIKQTTFLNPEEQAIYNQRREVILKGIEKLPTIYRQVIELHYFNGLDLKEIAAITETPEGTIKTRNFYGRKHLREILTNRNDL